MNKTIVEFSRAGICVLMLVGLAACGGGGGDSGSSATQSSNNSSSSGSSQTTQPQNPPSSSTTVNSVPQISGSASNQVAVGQAYSFTPSASDADHDTLSFSIAGKPSWASFDSSNGRLYGTPSAGDVGSYGGIVISVSDGQATQALAQFSVNVVAQSNGSITLSWQAPTQNTDGSTLANLSGYKILYGTQPGQYTQTITVSNASLTRYVIENLSAGTYYLVMKTVTSTGTESDPSAEANLTI